MKITTEHCVYAIMKHFYESGENNPLLLRFKLWKRLSKSGTGDNIVRVFQNTETGTIVKVQSSESMIWRVLETPKSTATTSIKAFLKEKNNEIEDLYYSPYDIFGEEEVENWPTVRTEWEDGYEDEPLDMENFEWISITDNELVVACGGDWQNPQTLTIKIVNGKLSVTHSEEGYPPTALSEEQFSNIIK